jgi:hypothetical protein
VRKPFDIKKTRKSLHGMVMRHEGTYGLRIFPFEFKIEKTPPVERFRVDRWTPEDEMGKNKISEYQMTKGEWIQVRDYPLWFAFEDVTEFNEKHSGDYFDLIIIRPDQVNHSDALEIVSTVVR